MKLILPQSKKPVSQATPNQDTLPVPFETLEMLYQETLRRLEAKGVGDPAWLNNLDLDDPAYNEAKDRLNRVWLEALEGRATLEEFKEALAHYEEVVLNSARPRVEVQGGYFEAGF